MAWYLVRYRENFTLQLLNKYPRVLNFHCSSTSELMGGMLKENRAQEFSLIESHLHVKCGFYWSEQEIRFAQQFTV
jgi:hypothetical protein